MIIQANKVQVIDVEIDPVNVIYEIESLYKELNGIPSNYEWLKVDRDGVEQDGWYVYERWGHGSDYSFKRYLTQSELDVVRALNIVKNLAEELN